MSRYNANNNNQQQVAVLPEVSDVTSMVVRGATNFAKRYKVVTGSYLLGIAVLLFAGAGIPLSIDQQRQYEQIMDSVDIQAEYDASQNVYVARQNYYATKGWFWSCDPLCQRNKARMNDAERELAMIRAEGAARMSDAKKVAGIFSEVGVGETKDSFFTYFHSGKRFAKRQSMWDLFFMSIRSMHRGRDESWFEFALKVLLNVLINFSMGLLMALVFFVIGLWSIVRSYQANPIVSVLYFVGAACAAFAFVSSYLMAVYGAAGASVYGFLKLAETSSRQRIADQRRGQQRVGYEQQQRPHWD